MTSENIDDNDEVLNLQNIATLACFLKYIIIKYMNDFHNIHPNEDEVLDFVIDQLHSLLYE